jgi:hypothetical protein
MLPDDIDVESRIDYFARPLSPTDRQAFREAALNALAALPCAGPGSIHRALHEVWRGFFHAPPDQRIGESRFGVRRRSKLINGEAIGSQREDRARAVLFSRSGAAG